LTISGWPLGSGESDEDAHIEEKAEPVEAAVGAAGVRPGSPHFTLSRILPRISSGHL